MFFYIRSISLCIWPVAYQRTTAVNWSGSDANCDQSFSWRSAVLVVQAGYDVNLGGEESVLVIFNVNTVPFSGLVTVIVPTLGWLVVPFASTPVPIILVPLTDNDMFPNPKLVRVVVTTELGDCVSTPLAPLVALPKPVKFPATGASVLVNIGGIVTEEAAVPKGLDDVDRRTVAVFSGAEEVVPVMGVEVALFGANGAPVPDCTGAVSVNMPVLDTDIEVVPIVPLPQAVPDAAELTPADGGSVHVPAVPDAEMTPPKPADHV